MGCLIVVGMTYLFLFWFGCETWTRTLVVVLCSKNSFEWEYLIVKIFCKQWPEPIYIPAACVPGVFPTVLEALDVSNTTNNWTTLAPMNINRAFHAAAVVDGWVCAFGGMNVRTNCLWNKKMRFERWLSIFKDYFTKNRCLVAIGWEVLVQVYFFSGWEF